jgi:hypothetical protein
MADTSEEQVDAEAGEHEHECGPDCMKMSSIDIASLSDEDKEALKGILSRVVTENDPARLFDKLVASSIVNADQKSANVKSRTDEAMPWLEVMLDSKENALTTVMHAALTCVRLLKKTFPDYSPAEIGREWEAICEQMQPTIVIDLEGKSEEAKA